MKRNPELMRKILQKVEDADEIIFAEEMPIEGFSTKEIVYHTGLLVDAGFIKASVASTFIGIDFTIERLTNDGHDFLEASRNETAWKKTIDRMAATGGFVLEFAKPILLEFFKQQLNLP